MVPGGVYVGAADWHVEAAEYDKDGRVLEGATVVVITCDAESDEDVDMSGVPPTQYLLSSV